MHPAPIRIITVISPFICSGVRALNQLINSICTPPFFWWFWEGGVGGPLFRVAHQSFLRCVRSRAWLILRLPRPAEALGQAQDIVCADFIVLAESYQVSDGHFIFSSFVVGPLHVVYVNFFCKFSLSVSVVYSFVYHSLYIVHSCLPANRFAIDIVYCFVVF